jgi:hypothetical protein
MDLMSMIRNKTVTKELPDLEPSLGNQLGLAGYPVLPKGGGNPYAGSPIVNQSTGANSARFTHQEPNGHMLGMSF